MEHELLDRASARLHESAAEAAEALRLLLQFEEQATRVYDAFGRIDQNGMECISRLSETVEQLRQLSELVPTIGVEITPCPLHRGE